MIRADALSRRLNKHYASFPEGIDFGIKIMKSPEYPVDTKYEKVFQYFCDKLPEYSKTLLESEKNNESWDIVNKFLTVPFPLTALSYKMQERICDTICQEAVKSKNYPKPEIFVSLVKVIEHKKYAQIIAIAINYCTELITLTNFFDNECFHKVIEDLSHYVQGAKINIEFRQIFYDTILTPFTFFIKTQQKYNKSNTYANELINFVQQLFFSEQNLELYTELFNGQEMEVLVNVFQTKNVPKDVLLIVIESFCKSYKNASSSFLEFLFEKIYNPGTEILSTEDCLDSIIKVLKIFKSYDIKIQKQDIVDEFDMIEFLREKFEIICAEYYEEHTSKILELVLATIAYNPLIMERRSFSVLVNCMFVPKDNKELVQLYDQFVQTIIRMTNDLRRGEYFVVYLIKALREKLETYEISKTLKRKMIDDVSKSGNKRFKTDNSSSNEYPISLNESDESANTAGTFNSNFKDIVYAWPYNATAQEFSHLISLLTSRQMVTTWRLLSEFLTEEISSLEHLTENKIFLIELIACILCQFLSNNQLVEQLHLYWDIIIERCKNMKNLLNIFGKAILQKEHNRRLINAFLSISFEFSNFETLMWYYSPDSIATDKWCIEQYPDLPELDFKKLSKSLFGYLDEEEWKLIEQRIKNFGKLECLNNLGLIHAQKVYVALLFGGHKAFKKNWETLMNSVMNDEKLILNFVKKEFINIWLVAHLNRKQKTNVAELLLNNDHNTIFMNKEFMECLDMTNILCLVGFKKLCSQKNSLLQNIHFDKVFDMDIEYVAAFISKNVSKDKEFPEVNYDLKDIELLSHLPIAHTSKECKTVLFGLLLGLLANRCTNENQIKVQKDLIACISVLLHFPEEYPDIFQYYKIDALLEIFGQIENYEQLVHYIKQKKISKDDLEKLEYKYSDAIFAFISSGIDISDKTELLNKAEIEFIRKTGECFQVLGTNNDDLCLLVLENKAKFQLCNETVSFLVLHVWNKFLQFQKYDQVKQDLSVQKKKKQIISLIFSMKTKNEIESTMNDLADQIKENTKHNETIIYVCKILFEIAENGISKSKTSEALEKHNIFGTISSRIFADIINNSFKDKDLCSPENINTVYEILKAQIAITTNIRIPMSPEIVQNCITIILKINIKKMTVTEKNISTFFEYHKLMAELIFILVTYRSDHTMNYLPSLLLVFKDLLLSISSYKNHRPLDEQINNSELSLLADVAHKLEKITNQLIKHDRALKLLTPFIITSCILSHILLCTEYNKKKTWKQYNTGMLSSKKA
uniref:CSON003196 protein n=1 Tax=Culicoides sonorensis TaxID=179676 RepID=A0A336MKU8_CULSO